MKHRTTDAELLQKHDEAWKALKAHPLDIEIEKLFARISELETWDPKCQTLAEHEARYEAGKPREIRMRINTLQTELFKTAESIRWFEIYQKLYA
jgi:hypothetical protein